MPFPTFFHSFSREPPGPVKRFRTSGASFEMSISSPGRLAFFDEERLLVSAPRGDSVLCGEEILLNAAMVGLELILHV